MRYRVAILLLLLTFAGFAQLGNTITKSDFNFGHQLGYMYSRMDSAAFRPAGEWSFETGFLAYYTSSMPQVTNPGYRERLMLLVPLNFEVAVSDWVALQVKATDLFVEFPYESIHNVGGKSPMFCAKMGLLREGPLHPALALTCGVKFSSAKPYTIWAKKHNYVESNGLAGADTGVADYLLLFTATRHFLEQWAVDARLGLAPLGSPVEYVRGSGQADEIPYGLRFRFSPSPLYGLAAEVSGMKNGLSGTRLAHYSVARLTGSRSFGRLETSLDLEKGLTRESDEWVAGTYLKFNLGKE